jgi:hypothetical protein
MGRHGSETAHNEKLREMAGPAADAIFDAPKKYPDLDASIIDKHLAAGHVCAIKYGESRLLVYRHAGEAHALVTMLAHAGYRRRYRKLSKPTVEALVALISREIE